MRLSHSAREWSQVAADRDGDSGAFACGRSSLFGAARASITGSEHTGQRRLQPRICRQETLPVQLHELTHDLGIRCEADEDEHPGRVELAPFSGEGVLDDDRLEVALPRQLDGVDIRETVDVGVLGHLLDDDLAGCELGVAGGDGDVPGEAGQEEPLLSGGVAAAADEDVLAR